MKIGWIRLMMLVLVFEKIVQHVFVTLAFYFNWSGIRSTVAINADVLMVLGGIVSILFAVGFWGLWKRMSRAAGLVTGLAIFDIIGEFVAQGRMDIVINVSFLVAVTLVILTAVYQRRAARIKKGTA